MKKVYYLKTCSTCSKILSQLNLDGFEKVEIKSQNITLGDLEEMFSKAKSYESLFSKTAMKFRSLKLNETVMSEEDYKKWILEEYTFLKRPVFIIDDEIFIGNTKKITQQLIAKIGIIPND